MSVRTISLILTLLNESSTIAGLRDSIDRQTRLPDEVVVVDGGSSDDTLDLLSVWSSEASYPIKVLPVPGCGIAEGRNIAISEAIGEVVSITDGGSILPDTWIEDLSRAIEDGANVASGFFYSSRSEGVGAIVGAVITPTLDEIDPDSFLPSSRSIALERRAALDVGGYPEWLDYCEDLVFDIELRQRGYLFVFVPSAAVGWDARSTLGSYAKQYYRYARGDGKAGLWPKRHAVRYLAYAMGLFLLLVSRRVPLLLLPLFAGVGVHLRRPYQRLLHSKDRLNYSHMKGLALVPGIVLLGDLSKMAGYPVGVLWRFQRRM